MERANPARRSRYNTGSQAEYEAATRPSLKYRFSE
jgi:hypothetical protein